MIPVIEVESILISSTGQAVTVTSTGSKLGLDVNVLGGVVQVRLTGDNLRYSKMSEDVLLTNGSYDTVYSLTSTGKVIWAQCRLSNNDVDIKVTVDSNIIIYGFNLNDLYANYDLDAAVLPSPPDFIHTYKQGKGILLTFPGGLEFDYEFKIELKANQTNVYLNRGMVVRAVS